MPKRGPEKDNECQERQWGQLVFNLVSVSFQSEFTHFSSVDCLKMFGFSLVFIISIVSFTFVWGLTLGVLNDLTNSEKT